MLVNIKKMFRGTKFVVALVLSAPLVMTLICKCSNSFTKASWLNFLLEKPLVVLDAIVTTSKNITYCLRCLS